MGQVIDLFSKAPHVAGTAICMKCAHTWTAVAPIGTIGFECPHCSEFAGEWVLPISYTDEEHWRCECGEEEFSITKNFVYCPRCGKIQKGIIWERV